MYKYPLYRNNNSPSHPVLPPPCHPNPPPKKKQKFSFTCFKKDTCKSLNDVEHFLCDFNTFFKYIKLYNLLKK